MTAEFKPELPEGMALPDGHSINTAHADYKALEALARERGAGRRNRSAGYLASKRSAPWRRGACSGRQGRLREDDDEPAVSPRAPTERSQAPRELTK